MKALTGKAIIMAVMAVGLTASVVAKTIELTAEADRSFFLAGEKQTAYVRIGLRGCPVEILRERTPVNVAIVIDKSGSMSGDKIKKAKEAAILALHRLKSTDIASVVLYDSDVEVLIPATRLTDRDSMIRKIRHISAGGSTALYAGVQTGASEVRKFRSNDYVNRIVLLSDGLANVGPDTPKALGNLGANLVDEGISVTTIGLGLGYNEDLMSQLAYKSDGGHYFAEDADELAGVFDDEFNRATSVVAQQVKIEIVCGEDMRPVRLLGREGSIKDRTVTMEIQNIYSEHEKYAILEVEIPAQKLDATRELALVRISYEDMNTHEKTTGAGSVDIRFSDSKSKVESSLNKRVYADVVEQIAIEQNERALALRDAGQIDEAKKILTHNSSYLYMNADKLDSPKLAGYAGENQEDAENLDGVDWNAQRKSMRENQSMRKTQR